MVGAYEPLPYSYLGSKPISENRGAHWPLRGLSFAQRLLKPSLRLFGPKDVKLGDTSATWNWLFASLETSLSKAT